MSDLKFIDLSERMYKYTRTFSIKSIEDAMVELITNCIDAYNSSNIINNRQIFIECYLSDGIIKVRDYASGLDGNKICECF